jgi:hypothetical protein
MQFPRARSIDVYLEDNQSDEPYLVFSVDNCFRDRLQEMKAHELWSRIRSEICPETQLEFFHLDTENWGSDEK